MSLVVPITAHSLGVGDIKLHSALNQKLRAEIALSLAADEDLSDIKVTLATPEKFDKLGIAWSYFLSKVKFQPMVKANGKVVINMTSDEVVQEPFLDFLVEVSWPKGDIYKEFTVLVDPPVIYQQSSVDVATVSSTNPANNNSRGDAAVQNNFNGLAVEGQYGPTNSNDTLWKVAEKVNNNSDISVEQMMMALYKANPHAFYKKNVNALMQGKTLAVPKRPDIVQLSKRQANTQFYKQMSVWNGTAASEPDVQPVDTNDSNQLTLVPPVEDPVTNSEILTANTAGQEELVAKNQQLQERLAHLEKQFAIMQEMMAIKDQQLAALQNKQAETYLQTDPSINNKESIIIEPAEPVKEPVTLKAVEPDLIPKVTNQQGSLPVKEPIATTEPVGKPVKVTPPPAVKPLEHTVRKQSSLDDGDEGVNYYYMGLGLFLATAIGGLGWLFWRRRQDEEEINENSMFATSSEIFLPDTDVEDDLDLPIFDERSSYDVGTVDESSFLSEFTPSDFDVFETDQTEVDPTSETDVYLAYGRYQQAEELMRQAITDHPDKDDYKLKLLEIFYTSENTEAYEEYSRELISGGKKSEVNFWAKVIEMGKELIPNSALFSPDLPEETFPTDNKVDEASLGDDVAEDDDASLEQDVEHLDLEFDLSAFSLPDDNAGELLDSNDEVNAEADSGTESIDFDMSEFDALDSLDIDDSEESDALSTGSDEAIETIEFDADETDDINLDDFDFSSEVLDPSESQDTLVSPESDDASNHGDFEFDFDKISNEPVAEISTDVDQQSENSSLVSDLTDMDEFETKIDLAKAYIDMGDEPAAKEIAQEVLEMGNDAQKNEAQEIIDQLS